MITWSTSIRWASGLLRYGTHSDRPLLEALLRVAAALKLPIAGVNVDHVGTTDSESFVRYKIPRVTIHSLTQETLPILHSKKDALTAIQQNDYCDSYHLVSGYLAFLDTFLERPESSPAKR